MKLTDLFEDYRLKFYEMYWTDIKIKEIIFDEWITDNGYDVIDNYWYELCEEFDIDPDTDYSDLNGNQKYEIKNWIKYHIFDEVFNKACDNLYSSIEINGYVDIWRMVSLRDFRTLKLKQIGKFWSWDARSADAHWEQIGHRAYALIAGRVHVDEVEWIQTITQNVVMPEEREIFVMPESPIAILGVEYMRSNKRNHPEKVKIFNPPKKALA